MVAKKVDRFFGDILINNGRLDKEKLHYALSVQRSSKPCLLTGQILISSGYIKEEDVMMGLAVQYGFPFLPLDEYEVDKSLMSMLPIEFVLEHNIIPVEKIGNSLSVAMVNPLQWGVLKEIRDITNCHVTIFICTQSAIMNKIKLLYKHTDQPGSFIATTKKEVLR